MTQAETTGAKDQVADPMDRADRVKIEYRSASNGWPRGSLSALDLIVAGFMLSIGSCLIWLCLYVLLKPSPADGLRLDIWCIMCGLGAAGLGSVYAGIAVVLRVKAREKRREMDPFGESTERAMTQLEMTDAKDRLAELVDRARSGEEIVLSDAGKPVVKLGPADAAAREVSVDDSNPRLRMHGMFEGQIWMSDDFADPLTDEELKDWGL